jgi:hypothetical protein
VRIDPKFVVGGYPAVKLGVAAEAPESAVLGYSDLARYAGTGTSATRAFASTWLSSAIVRLARAKVKVV